jgi:hypothetical protein
VPTLNVVVWGKNFGSSLVITNLLMAELEINFAIRPASASFFNSMAIFKLLGG